MTFLEAAERVDAKNRLTYISDMSSILGGMFGGGDTLKEHIGDLTDVMNGE